MLPLTLLKAAQGHPMVSASRWGARARVSPAIEWAAALACEIAIGLGGVPPTDA